MNRGIRIELRTVYPVSIANFIPLNEVKIASFAAPKRSDPIKLRVEFKDARTKQQDGRLGSLRCALETNEGLVNGVDPSFDFVIIEFHFEPFLLIYSCSRFGSLARVHRRTPCPRQSGVYCTSAKSHLSLFQLPVDSRWLHR